MKKSIAAGVFVVAIVIAACPSLSAIPVLQLYAEGARYDSATESWLLSDITGGSAFYLWAIGNTESAGKILDVRLSVACEQGFAGTISIAPARIGGTGSYGGFTDPSVSNDPSYLQTVTDGSRPELGNGKQLQPHGEYGEGIFWQEYLLGNFALKDSHIADFAGAFPDPTRHLGQINAYEVSIMGGNGHTFHFDLYDSGKKPKFAPFSHDLSVGTAVEGHAIPEPATIVLLGAGLALLGAAWPLRR